MAIVQLNGWRHTGFTLPYKIRAFASLVIIGYLDVISFGREGVLCMH